MKKTLLGIVGVLAMVSSANAVDTAQIKAACQSSDKTLWVERNQVCIPRNPCEGKLKPETGQYCNKEFSAVQLPVGGHYKNVINLYAMMHNLECKAVGQDGAMFGQDYVVCMGNDVMVFEFNDINDRTASEESVASLLCGVLGGSFGGKEIDNSESWGNIYVCYGVSEEICSKANTVYTNSGTTVNFSYEELQRDSFFWHESIKNPGKQGCFMFLN